MVWKNDRYIDIPIESWRDSLNVAMDYQERLRIPLEGNDHTRFETRTGLHVATG
jgi:hypothetical protein